MARTAVSLLLIEMVMVVTVMGAAVPRMDNNRSGREKRSESTTSEWSIWFNSDRPWTGEGDFETTDSIRKTQRICSWDKQVAAAECRVAGTNDTFDSTTAAFVKDHLLQACSSHGLICLNSQQQQQHQPQQPQQSSPHMAQKQFMCRDYEVRFLCQDLDTGDDDSLFPNFDFKIYILLAAVPLLVVTLRIVWSCCCKPRIKRRRQQLQNARRQHRNSQDSGTLSTSSSQASIDSTLAQPPPAYDDLFGEVDLQQLQQLQQQNRPVIFSISGGECVGCGKCLHQAHLTDVGGVRLLASSEGESGPSSPGNDDVFVPVSPRDINPITLDASDSAETSQSRSTHRRSSDVAQTSQNMSIQRCRSDVTLRPPNGSTQRRHSVTSANLFNQRRPSFTSQNMSTQRRYSDVVFAAVPIAPRNNAVSCATTVRSPIPSSSSLLGAASLPVTALSNTTSSPEAATSPTLCTCSCHRRQSGHLNLAFHWDASDPVESPTTVVRPGMHKPVFSFSRIGSVTSFTSFTSITELPDYEEALEILKKGGMFFSEEEEKEAKEEKAEAVP